MAMDPVDSHSHCLGLDKAGGGGCMHDERYGATGKKTKAIHSSSHPSSDAVPSFARPNEHRSTRLPCRIRRKADVTQSCAEAT
mmetsp:Transcript_21172/g.31684  ORF Transcript_21172/g.31684 Transcript_21172/m.31684 type:complete len:83 (-) Transcript_21172:230-478(-)